ncbi:MAG: threonine aldolase [Alphaproteobacteria bacterium PA4]|nr:MAG: threonine aldolase [Alphaproteobacteria bacterium PA4]
MDALATFLDRIAPPQTPVLIVRRTALMQNISAMQAACTAAGVRLRAHGKMHKSTALAGMQVAAGAVGVCCQTVGEAEAYAAAGIADVLVTAPVPPWGWPRLAAIRGAHVAAVIDSAEQLAQAAPHGLTLYVDVDLGQHRAGVTPGDALALAQAIAATPRARFGGIQAYCGHHQHIADAAARRDANAAATATLRALVAEFSAAGLPPRQVTGGGTGTYALDLAGGVFTEIQAGSYALMDVDYGVAGAPEGEWPFQPALFLAASIVSTRHVALATCDAGLKALYTDGPAPRVVAGAAPGSRWRSLGDEHGAILHPAFLERLRADPLGAIAAIDGDSARPADAPVEGRLVWLQPGHVDPTMALHSGFYLADEDGTLEHVAIDARRIA